MHDVTEGGILGAVWEICQVAILGVKLYEDKIPVDPVTVKLAQNLDFDYLRLISSGSMIIVAEASRASEIIKRCEVVGVSVSEIGEMTSASEGCKILVEAHKEEAKDGKPDDKSEGVWQEIDPPDADHIYKAFENLSK